MGKLSNGATPSIVFCFSFLFVLMFLRAKRKSIVLLWLTLQSGEMEWVNFLMEALRQSQTSRSLLHTPYFSTSVETRKRKINFKRFDDDEEGWFHHMPNCLYWQVQQVLMAPLNEKWPTTNAH